MYSTFPYCVILHRLHNCYDENKIKDPPGKVDIDVEFRPEDNPYLIVHECSGFDAQVGDSQNLQTIREFISYRTHASRSPSERLHAVWWRSLFLCDF
jgi:hypothetical protein